MKEKTPHEAVQEFLKRRSELTPKKQAVYRARMTGKLKTNREIGEMIGLSEAAVTAHIPHIREKGLPLRDSSYARQPVLPAVPEQAIAEKRRDVATWAKELGVWQPQNGTKRPIVVSSPSAHVISANELDDMKRTLFETRGYARSSIKIHLAESVRLGLISPEDLAKQFSLHEETVLSWIERLWKDRSKKLYVKFDSNVGMTPLCAKLLSAALAQRVPINIGEILFDPTSRNCRVGEQSVQLPPLEARLLLALSLFPGLFVDTETLYSFLFADVDADRRPKMNIVHVLMGHLENELSSLQVQTIKGFGTRILPRTVSKSPGSI